MRKGLAKQIGNENAKVVETEEFLTWAEEEGAPPEWVGEILALLLDCPQLRSTAEVRIGRQRLISLCTAYRNK